MSASGVGGGAASPAITAAAAGAGAGGGAGAAASAPPGGGSRAAEPEPTAPAGTTPKPKPNKKKKKGSKEASDTAARRFCDICDKYVPGKVTLVELQRHIRDHEGDGDKLARQLRDARPLVPPATTGTGAVPAAGLFEQAPYKDPAACTLRYDPAELPAVDGSPLASVLYPIGRATREPTQAEAFALMPLPYDRFMNALMPAGQREVVSRFHRSVKRQLNLEEDHVTKAGGMTPAAAAAFADAQLGINRIITQLTDLITASSLRG